MLPPPAVSSTTSDAVLNICIDSLGLHHSFFCKPCDAVDSVIFWVAYVYPICTYVANNGHVIFPRRLQSIGHSTCGSAPRLVLSAKEVLKDVDMGARKGSRQREHSGESERRKLKGCSGGLVPVNKEF